MDDLTDADYMFRDEGESRVGHGFSRALLVAARPQRTFAKKKRTSAVSQLRARDRNRYG